MNKKDKKKELELWKTAAWDMLYLVQCSINSLVPDLDRVAKMNLAMVYARCTSQSLEAMTYMALEKCMEKYPSVKFADKRQVLAQWKEAKDKAVRKAILMDAARTGMFAYLEKKKIWHVALKGAVLCHMYPEYGMRQMADNDIRFDPAFRQEVHDWFVENGYEVKSFEKSNHDEYQKKPVYNFEMHVSLFSESGYSKFAQYYRDIKDRLSLAPGKKFEYNMVDEDFYLYLLAHEYKHYLGNGVGLRSLADLFVYHQAKKDLNWEYLNAELKKLWLSGFERIMRELSETICNIQKSKEDLTKREKSMIESLILSNTYGNRKNFWYSYTVRAQKNGKKVPLRIKGRYLMRRLFPDRLFLELWCQKYEPYIVQHQWLMPIAPIWRIIKSGIKKRKLIQAELDEVRSA